MIKIPAKAQNFFYENIQDIFDSGNLAESKWNKLLAEQTCKYTSAAHCISFNSNGSAILATLMGLKQLKSLKYVFVQSNTMYGVKVMAHTSGLEVLDSIPCSLATLMPSAEQVECYLRSLKYPRETVFLLTHIGGIANPDIVRIAELCNFFGVILVEDCAHSYGATLNGQHTGTFGDAGIYSLYATKSIPGGEGGLWVSNNSELYDFLSRFNIYDRFDQRQLIGCNFRVSEVQALLSYSVCKYSEDIIENKSLIAQRYIEICKNKGINFIAQNINGQRGNYYKFIVLSNQDFSYDKLKSRTSPVYDYSLGPDPELIANRHLCLPIWYGLEDSLISNVVNELNSI
ncbi:DegT/DnrJ/EryC1/StrS aminotransferase family protein [Polynucleobacter sp. MWH-Spelu-300-X4]|uniref:DegT/DnrJ/EryC1/StrS family aminotransferase n=1 Tax=Polynucleobacter sp. MWH-Spelu-300-X4 TaxID=2689109 RepID=UPI001BFD1D8F|nr:DegT/DnrJ/EryC1/StrS family aminotransferase [Polynucleobacter sp. MWH-Spelu-300-X4]QWD80051.1 DegT/DnrJ/EryC1/StrS aminotransferase family protein [Polynucleobacter sp. MWH-Spelu-300-X4]